MRTAVKIGWMLMSRGGGGGTFCCASTHLLVCFLFICFHFNLSLLMTGFWPIVFLFAFPVYNVCLLVHYFCWQVCMFTCLLAIALFFLHVFFFSFAFTHPDVCLFSFCLFFRLFVCLQVFIQAHLLLFPGFLVLLVHLFDWHFTRLIFFMFARLFAWVLLLFKFASLLVCFVFSFVFLVCLFGQI